MKEKSYSLGQIAGLKLSAGASTMPAFILLWVVLAVLAYWLIRLPLAMSILAGGICTLLHYLSGTWHQLGHAWAARRSGYPMNGIYFWGVLSTSLYPAGDQ